MGMFAPGLCIIYLFFIGFISFYMGRALGYREGSDMAIRCMNKAVNDELQKSLSVTMERIRDQLHEDIYELRKSNTIREGEERS